MYLDGEEERMLRAIVEAAVVEAAAGRSFAGEFHHYVISASCLQVDEHGVAQVEARIAHAGRIVVRIRWRAVPATREGRCPQKTNATTTMRTISHAPHVRKATKRPSTM